jgi:hypothetical protein
LRLDFRDQPLFLPCLIGRHLNLLHLQHMVPCHSVIHPDLVFLRSSFVL